MSPLKPSNPTPIGPEKYNILESTTILPAFRFLIYELGMTFYLLKYTDTQCKVFKIAPINMLEVLKEEIIKSIKVTYKKQTNNGIKKFKICK